MNWQRQVEQGGMDEDMYPSDSDLDQANEEDEMDTDMAREAYQDLW